MNTTSKTQKLVYYAMIMAIIGLMAAVPFLGFIQILPIAITLVHIPVIIGTILFGWKAGILFGLTFGVSSMLVAITRGAATDVLFINPLVSVLPRVLFGALIFPLYSFLSKLIKSDSASIGVTAFISSFIHSILVITAIFLTLNMDAWEGLNSDMFRSIIAAVLTLNIGLEALAPTLIVVPVVIAMTRYLNRRGVDHQ